MYPTYGAFTRNTDTSKMDPFVRITIGGKIYKGSVNYLAG